MIEPLGLSGEDFYCEFGRVSRQGDTVSWRGKCNFNDEGDEPSVVTAQMRGKRLALPAEAGTVLSSVARSEKLRPSGPL
jgi:hypothetical protein